MDNHEINQGRRRFLVLATAGAGGLAAAGVATPFVASWFPSEKAKAAGAPIEIDVSKIESGQMLTAEWQGKPIWVVNRTDQQIKDLKGLDGVLTDPNSEVNHQPEDCKNETRSIKPNVLVAIGICTHLGHGSKFDSAGRVYAGAPAPTNLVVPPHKYLSDTTILVGDET